jgi:hypothetical protein
MEAKTTPAPPKRKKNREAKSTPAPHTHKCTPTKEKRGEVKGGVRG